MGITPYSEMKFNIADPSSGGQKLIEVDDEAKIRPFLEKRMGQEVEGENLGQEYKGYIFKITGGNDAQGFAMKQGIMGQGRARILFKKKSSLFNPKRTGYRRRRSVRGCITGSDLAVMSLKIIKKDNVCRYVARREIKRGDKTHYKAPKVQRLITEKRLRRKKVAKRAKLDRYKTSKEAAAKYEKLISQYVKEKKAARSAAAKEEAAAKTATKK